MYNELVEAQDPFLDFEADEDDEDSFDEEAEAEFWHGDTSEDEVGDDSTFSKFGELPPELRLRIWEFASLELVRPRVLCFHISKTMAADIHYAPRPPNTPVWIIYEGMGLEMQTLLARRIMSVSREARQFALKLCPHKLRFARTKNHEPADVAFNQTRDVVMVESFERVPFRSHFQLEGFAEHITQLAIGLLDFSALSSNARFEATIKQFSALKRLFVAGNAADYGRTRDLLWCGSEAVYRYDYTLREILSAWRHRSSTRICWPDADEYDDYARHHVPPIFEQGLPGGSLKFLSGLGVETFPMVSFEGERGSELFSRLERKFQTSLRDIHPDFRSFTDSNSVLSDDSSTLASGDDEADEYESEGIDDDSLDEHFGRGEDEDDLLVLNDEETSDDEQAAIARGNFSSPEADAEEPRMIALTSQSPVHRPNKRRLVIDSDDEVPHPNPTAKRARTKRAVLSDSDEEDEGDEAAFSRNKASTSGIIEHEHSKADSDEDLSNDEHEESSSRNRSLASRLKNAKKATIVSSDDEVDDDDDDEEEASPQRLSLAARLKSARQEIRVPSDSSSNYDSEGINDDNEEDDDDDDDDDDEEGSENGLIDGIAEESDDERHHGDSDEEGY